MIHKITSLTLSIFFSTRYISLFTFLDCLLVFLYDLYFFVTLYLIIKETTRVFNWLVTFPFCSHSNFFQVIFEDFDLRF